MSPLYLTLKKIQVMISLQLIQSPGLLDEGGGVIEESSVPVLWQFTKILDFLGDYGEEDIYFLLLEKCLFHVANNYILLSSHTTN
jgi:hypothetical protein